MLIQGVIIMLVRASMVVKITINCTAEIHIPVMKALGRGNWRGGRIPLGFAMQGMHNESAVQARRDHGLLEVGRFTSRPPDLPPYFFPHLFHCSACLMG
jgi:hypothetical protein